MAVTKQDATKIIIGLEKACSASLVAGMQSTFVAECGQSAFKAFLNAVQSTAQSGVELKSEVEASASRKPGR